MLLENITFLKTMKIFRFHFFGLDLFVQLLTEPLTGWDNQEHDERGC